VKFIHQAEVFEQTEEAKEAERKAKVLMDRLEKICKSVGGNWDLIDKIFAYEATCTFPSPQSGGIKITNYLTPEGKPVKRRRAPILLNFWMSKEMEGGAWTKFFEVSKNGIEVPEYTTIEIYSERKLTTIDLEQPSRRIRVYETENISKFRVEVTKTYSRLEITLF